MMKIDERKITIESMVRKFIDNFGFKNRPYSDGYIESEITESDDNNYHSLELYNFMEDIYYKSEAIYLACKLLNTITRMISNSPNCKTIENIKSGITTFNVFEYIDITNRKEYVDQLIGIRNKIEKELNSPDFFLSVNDNYEKLNDKCHYRESDARISLFIEYDRNIKFSIVKYDMLYYMIIENLRNENEKSAVILSSPIKLMYKSMCNKNIKSVLLENHFDGELGKYEDFEYELTKYYEDKYIENPQCFYINSDEMFVEDESGSFELGINHFDLFIELLTYDYKYYEDQEYMYCLPTESYPIEIHYSYLFKRNFLFFDGSYEDNCYPNILISTQEEESNK